MHRSLYTMFTQPLQNIVLSYNIGYCKLSFGENPRKWNWFYTIQTSNCMYHIAFCEWMLKYCDIFINFVSSSSCWRNSNVFGLHLPFFLISWNRRLLMEDTITSDPQPASDYTARHPTGQPTSRKMALLGCCAV